MRKSISDWRRNSFPDTVVIWGRDGQRQVSTAHRTDDFLQFSPLRTRMLPFVLIPFVSPGVTKEFWTSVWKLFRICHNKRDIVSAVQPPNTNSAKITIMWQKLRKARKLNTIDGSNVNQIILERNECNVRINSCYFQFAFLFWYYYFISDSSILEFAHLLCTCDPRVHFQVFWWN